ncbi:hypothetical protein SAY87_006524 [Trapa incisa]|uniref:Uncharacterized protein n=1 Tax=Trapa incisa TaxID=236973 RepID=A0AAN7K117_9MYRT|nr:hypothetical protein SAY87_006524 [Trapa incisa]
MDQGHEEMNTSRAIPNIMKIIYLSTLLLLIIFVNSSYGREIMDTSCPFFLGQRNQRNCHNNREGCVHFCKGIGFDGGYCSANNRKCCCQAAILKEHFKDKRTQHLLANHVNDKH